MRVRVLFFGILKDIVGTSEENLEVTGGATPGSIFDDYAARFETLRNKRPSILFARNQEFTKPAAALSEGDEVAFLPPVSGGSGPEITTGEGHLFAITRDPIDTDALSQKLKCPEDGAVVIFEGIVRNNTKGRKTLYLEYECYEKMALDGMVRIGREIAAQFSLSRIGAIHRLGRLAIGEASVVIVATSPHRRSAFEGALLMIDRLKREVPVWKKEFFEDGAVWVEGEWDQRLQDAASNLHA